MLPFLTVPITVLKFLNLPWQKEGTVGIVSVEFLRYRKEPSPSSEITAGFQFGDLLNFSEKSESVSEIEGKKDSWFPV